MFLRQPATDEARSTQVGTLYPCFAHTAQLIVHPRIQLAGTTCRVRGWATLEYRQTPDRPPADSCRIIPDAIMDAPPAYGSITRQVQNIMKHKLYLAVLFPIFQSIIRLCTVGNYRNFGKFGPTCSDLRHVPLTTADVPRNFKELVPPTTIVSAG